MTQKENITEAIKHLEDAIDRFADKDDEIREYNKVLYDILDRLEKILAK